MSTVNILNSNVSQGSAAGTYGSLYLFQGNTTQNIVSGSSPAVITCWNSANGAVGQYNNVVPSKTNSNITLNSPGIYQISWAVSYYTNTNNIHLEIYPFASGSQLKNIGAKQINATSSQTAALSSTGHINVTTANTVIDLRGFHDNAQNTNVVFTHGSLAVNKIG